MCMKTALIAGIAASRVAAAGSGVGSAS